MAGSIDTSFFTVPGGSISALAILPDNQALVGGNFSTWNGNSVRSLVRLGADGSLDPFFQAPIGMKLVSGLWIQSDGKILVAGSFTNIVGEARTNFVRLSPEGGFDNSFTANVDFSVADVSQLPEGRLLIAGSFRNVNGIPRPGIAVLFPNGDVDPSFNPESGITGNGRSARVLSDGRFVVAGLTHSDGIRSIFGMLRFSPSGQVDRSFELDNASFFARTIYPLPHDNLILNSVFTLTRALSSDAIDQHYTNGAGSVFAEILAVQPDERQIVGGSSLVDSTGAPSKLVRLFADGKIDPTFQTSLSFNPSLAVIRPDGKILVAGFNNLVALHSNDATAPTQIYWHASELDAIHNGPATLKVIRQGSLAGSSTVDWSVTTEGVQVTPTSGQVQYSPGQSIADVTVQLTSPNNMTGSAQFNLSDPQGAALAFNGILTLHVTNQTGTISTFQTTYTYPEPQGPILFTTTRAGAQTIPAEVGWKITGATDPSFDFSATSGVVYFGVNDEFGTLALRTKDNPTYQSSRSYQIELFTVNPDFPTTSETNITVIITDNDFPAAAGIAADDSIPRGAIANDGGAFLHGSFQTINGQPHPTFARLDAGGRLKSDFQNPDFVVGISDIIELPDRRILLGGSFTNVNTQGISQVVRLLPNGQLDPTFIPTPLKASGPIAVAADGSILVAGNSANFNGSIGATNLGAIVRLKPDGEKDTNFFTLTTASNHRIVTLPNGQFYAHGTVFANTNFYLTGLSNAPLRAGVIRFNANGSVDTNFSATFGGTNSAFGPNRLSALPDGRIMVGGFATNAVVNGRTVPDLARLSSTGELDLQFLTNSSNALGRNFRLMAFDVSPQGKTLVFRQATSGGGAHSLVLLGPTGLVEKTNSVAFPNSYIVAATIRAYPDGRFLVTGPFVQIAGQPRFRFAWINPDGTLAPLGNVVVDAFTRNGPQNSITVTTLTAGQYKLQKSADLANWTDVMPIALNTGENTIQFQDSGDASFYRVIK